MGTRCSQPGCERTGGINQEAPTGRFRTPAKNSLLGTKEGQIVRTAQENQHLCNALSLRIRFICKHPDIQNSSGQTRWMWASQSPTGNLEVGGAGPEGALHTAAPSCQGVLCTLCCHPQCVSRGESSIMVQGCLLERFVRRTGSRKEQRGKNKGCTPAVSSGSLAGAV